jgi:hypothetical protein
MNHYWSVFLTLLATPFEHLGLIWGIVPIYFGLLLNETTSTKANFRTSIQTGFSFVWAGAHWLYPVGTKNSCRLSVIEFQQSSQSLSRANLAGRFADSVRSRGKQDHVPLPLVVSFTVKMLDVI